MGLLLKCEHVGFGYENQDAVLDVNLEVNEGDYICIVGENGSGKSTLMKGILGLLKPTSGRIEYSEELKNYLSNVHYMDKYLGKYLNFLKENHLYHNSIIIIASDHSISNDWLKSKEEDNVSFQIPLYIVNSPQKIDKTSDYAITQADLFPTLLDLGGIHSEWRGVGNSLLCPDSILNTEREKKRIIYREKISDIILDSDYFKGKKISK